MAVPKTYLIEVVPVSKSPKLGALSYFSSEKIPLGTLVKIPLRQSAGLGIVLRVKDVKSAKSDIRKASFSLKKIKKSDITGARIDPRTIEALETCSKYYATSLGAILSNLLPKIISNNPSLLTNKLAKGSEKRTETLLYQMETEERFSQYRSIIRGSFARKASVMFVVPTHLDIERAERELSRGIEEFVFSFSASDKTSVAQDNWSQALKDKHPILFITTPAGLLFSRSDMDTVIIERENSRAYRTLVRPFIDFRLVIEEMCRQVGLQLVLGDSTLSLKTLWRERLGEFSESSITRWRLTTSPTKLVESSIKQNDGGRFEIFSPELKTFIQEALEKKEGVFLFGARKGLYPTTVCGDCGHVLACKNCFSPAVLHKKKEENIYICHACGSRRESTTLCDYCKSWKLVPLGIGVEEIARRAQELFAVPVQIIDKENAPSDAKARKIVQEFKDNGGILVGTELAFFHLESVAYSGLVSVDALFSVPDFHINERVFYLISRLREMSYQGSLIQTRNIGQQTLTWASQGNILDFYQNEIHDRESLLYPPFSIFIKIEGEGIERVKEHFAPWSPDIVRKSLIIRVSYKEWPQDELLKKLSLLGPEFSIKVDPESII